MRYENDRIYTFDFIQILRCISKQIKTSLLLFENVVLYIRKFSQIL